jgi:predicted dehydrogenase
VIREFVACVDTGTVPEIISTDNIKSMVVVYAAVESAQSGRSVRVAL